MDNRSKAFHVYSQTWNYYADDGKAFLIAHESIFKNWEWSINPATCPARLLNPVRVSKESTATLVIHNVTLADSGTYGCILVFKKRSPITSKVKLVVTCRCKEFFIIFLMDILGMVVTLYYFSSHSFSFVISRKSFFCFFLLITVFRLVCCCFRFFFFGLYCYFYCFP